MEESPPGTLGGDAPAVDTTTPEQYTLLKTRFKTLQEDALALATAYERACEELRYQEECKAVMVEKLAQIRVRRMNAYLRVPENGMMFFMEESKPGMRKLHPTASRREIRRLLQREWDTMLEEEQHEWQTRLHAVVAKARKHEESKKSTLTSQRKKPSKASSVSGVSTTSIAVSPSVSGVKATTVKRKAPPSASAPRAEVAEKPKKKRKTETNAKVIDAGSEAEDSSQSVAVSTKATPKPKLTPSTKTPRPKAAPRLKKVPTEMERGSKTDENSLSTPKKSTKKTASSKAAPYDAGEASSAASPVKQVTTPRKLPAKPKKAATPKVKKVATPTKKEPGSTSTPRKKAAPKAAKRTPPKKKAVKRLASDSEIDDDDDDEDDDDDDDDTQTSRRRGRTAPDDDSASSGGGSGSDEDDEDQLAQLPTGAFG